MTIFDAAGDRVGIRRPTAQDCDEFIQLMQVSRQFHLPWLDPPKAAEAFDGYLRSRQEPWDAGFLVCCRQSGRIMGVININCIVGGFFQSGYLGYYVGAPYAGQGYMTEGMRLVTRYAFAEMKLHRLEANIQPGNCAIHRPGPQVRLPQGRVLAALPAGPRPVARPRAVGAAGG